MGETEARLGPRVNRELAGRIAHRLYGSKPSLRWVPSDEVDVFVASFAGDGAEGVPDKVIKLDRPGRDVAAREQRLLPYLLQVGVEVPPIEHAGVEPGGDVPGAEAETVAFNVQPFLERRGIGKIYAEDEERARDVAQRLGRAVARLHALPLSQVPELRSAEETRYWRRRSILESHARYRATFPHRNAAFDAVCARVADMLERLPAHFGNGQGYQSLFDGRGTFAVMDWGTCGVFWRMYDLAHAVGAMDIWCRWERPPEGTAVSAEDIRADLVPRMLAAYVNEWGSALSESDLNELALWHAHGALMLSMSAWSRGQEEHAQVRLAAAEHALREGPGAIE